MRGVVVGEQPNPTRRGDLEAAEKVCSSTDVDSMPNGSQVGRLTLRFGDDIGRRIAGAVVKHHALGVLVQLGQDDLERFFECRRPVVGGNGDVEHRFAEGIDGEFWPLGQEHDLFGTHSVGAAIPHVY